MGGTGPDHHGRRGCCRTVGAGRLVLGAPGRRLGGLLVLPHPRLSPGNTEATPTCRPLPDSDSRPTGVETWVPLSSEEPRPAEVRAGDMEEEVGRML